MRITIAALGTRGDVQPMIALGKGLKAAGHQVCLIAGSNFETWVRSHGLTFAGAVNMEDLMQTPDGIRWAESSHNPLEQLEMMKRLLRQYGRELVKPLIELADQTDLYLSVFVSEPFVQSVCEKYGLPQINVPLQPYLPTRSGKASLMPAFPQRSNLVNLWLGLLGERMIWSISQETVSDLRQMLALPPQTVASYLRAYRSVPTIFGFSSQVVPLAPDWDAHVHVGGYWFLEDAENWQPDSELIRFLESDSRPVYIGFGSMPGRHPQAIMNLVGEALKQAGQRAVMIRGWNRSTHLEYDPNRIFLLDSVPHSWLFDRVAAVIHHGGAGTTATGLRAGRPTMVIPHMSDQPFWGRRVHELGAGTRPIPRHKLNAADLAAGIQKLVTDKHMRGTAEVLAESIQREDGVARTVALIERYAYTGIKV
jgi:UDP:flavonoid glycosyltransferase YjiC (YdhE family)